MTRERTVTIDRASVVVGVDGSAAALAAVRWAAARAVRDGRPLRIVHAYALPLGFPAGVTEEESILAALRREGRRWLAEARDAATESMPLGRVDTELVAAPAATALLRESEDAAVLVAGNQGRNTLTGLLVGSTSLALASRAHCPVVLVRAGHHATEVPEVGPVVVGVDGTEASEAAVAFAFAEAAAQHAPLIAVHAYTESVLETALAADDTSMDWTLQHQLGEETLAERLAGWQEKYPQVSVEREVVHDRPAQALRQRAQTARLVVVGRRGRSGFRDLILGSTSQHLLHHAIAPVAVVRTNITEQREMTA
jgi:nucleotide-binding universal stress UspA family protein